MRTLAAGHPGTGARGSWWRRVLAPLVVAGAVALSGPAPTAAAPTADQPLAVTVGVGPCTITVPTRTPDHAHWVATCPEGSLFVLRFPPGHVRAGAMWDPETDQAYNAGNSSTAVRCAPGAAPLALKELEQERGLMTTSFSPTFPDPAETTCGFAIALAEPGQLAFQVAMPDDVLPTDASLVAQLVAQRWRAWTA